MVTLTFKLEELEEKRWTKRELAEEILLVKWESEGRCEFDYALPQNWLDKFSKLAKLDYHLVASTTFWVLESGCTFGYPVSGCYEVQSKIKLWRQS